QHHDPSIGVFAPGSPFWQLYLRDARILLIGCGHGSNSMIHVAEEIVHVPYVTRTRPARRLRPDGTIEALTVRRPGCSNGFPAALGAPLRDAGAIIDGRIVAAPVMLLR